MADGPPFLKLCCTVQKYAWGKVGSSSEVAQLASFKNPQFLVDENVPYAELWMGTHPSGPTTISSPPQLAGQLLSSWLLSNTWALGEKSPMYSNGQLPFLLKVLSVNKALSIQAHPNKAHAEILHRTRPDLYPDPNHKPELGIALGQFEGFCGFRPFTDIQNFLLNIPELRNVISVEKEDSVKDMLQIHSEANEEKKKIALKAVFSALMNSPIDQSRAQLQNLVENVRNGNHPGVPDLEKALLLRLYNQYPGDIGCFAVFFINYVCLEEGQAIFLAANEPHAYLYGDLVECMACSDNVVRAGLTPKYVDKDTLCQMLTYNMKSAQENIFPSIVHPLYPYVHIYEPPVSDFAVHRIAIPVSCEDFILPVIPGPSTMVVIYGVLQMECCGAVELMHKGTVIFLPANRHVKFRNCTESAMVFRAYCNSQ